MLIEILNNLHVIEFEQVKASKLSNNRHFEKVFEKICFKFRKKFILRINNFKICTHTYACMRLSFNAIEIK